jgi:hypothetical protein
MPLNWGSKYYMSLGSSTFLYDKAMAYQESHTGNISNLTPYMSVEKRCLPLLIHPGSPAALHGAYGLPRYNMNIITPCPFAVILLCVSKFCLSKVLISSV